MLLRTTRGRGERLSQRPCTDQMAREMEYNKCARYRSADARTAMVRIRASSIQRERGRANERRATDYGALEVAVNILENVATGDETKRKLRASVAKCGAH